MQNNPETPANAESVGQPTSEAPLAATHGSADGRGYARGYAAGIKRVKQLEAEIARLNEIKTPPPLPDSHDTTIEYLITTAEAMVGAANMLMAMRNPPNAESSHAASATDNGTCGSREPRRGQ